MLDWEEGLFRGGLSLIRALWIRPKERPFETAKVPLADHRLEWFYLAHLVAGQRLSFFESDEALLRIGNRICLPTVCKVHRETELNLELYHLKVVLGALSIRQQTEQKPFDFDSLREVLRAEYPALDSSLSRQLETLPDTYAARDGLSKVMTDASAQDNLAGRGSADADADTEPKDAGAKPVQVTTELEGKGQTEVKVLEGEEIEAPDVPQHVFEKVETLEEFGGVDRQLDGGDELQDHDEALDELDMKHVLRSKDRTSSVYRADMVMSPFELELASAGEPQGRPYPEWDFRLKAYRENWCFVQNVAMTSTDDVWAAEAKKKHAANARQLKRRLAQFATDMQRVKSQPFGDEFDMDALIAAHVTTQTGGAPSENLYVRRHRALSDIATLVLIDLSDSTDAWVKGAHVLDIMRGALLVLGEALEDHTREFAIAGFASDTRRNCRFFSIKDFHEDWRGIPARLGGLSPQGYTRMGPAVRHATHLLECTHAARKALLLVGDGRPCDYDRYEGRYGIQDVKRAFAEAHEAGILTHAFAVDQKAREHFPAMFPPKGFHVIAKPDDLADAVFRFFIRLKSM